MELQDKEKQKEFLRKYQGVNRKMEEEEASAASLMVGVPYIDLSHFPMDLNAMGLWTKEQAAEYNSVIFFKEGGDLRVGTVDPRNVMLKKALDDLKHEHHLSAKIYLISHASFADALKMYEKIARPVATHEDIVEVKSENDYTASLKELESKPALSATEILSIIFGAAEKMHASDVHLEPEEKFMKVRFRLDGVLSDAAHLPKEYQKAVISRIKILSKLKLNIEDAPQDGRFSYSLDGKPTDVRVSILPSAYGEGLVMRILSSKATSLHFDDLGFTGRSYDLIKQELQKPNGMIITTGPTGSGKTTTLYAFLNFLNEPGVKIITLEDPVEYKLEGISQTPVNGASGVSFAGGLRAILRQDPDIIMVGEIRDQETADVALQAALTGHIVLSTLHTNDAAGAIPRLRNMGIRPYVIAPAMNAIIAQRLVRKLCPDCKEPIQLEPFMLEKAVKILKSISPKAEFKMPEKLVFYHSKGCDKCHGTGYKGRIGVYEVIVKSEKLEKLILSEATSMDINKLMIEDGMVSMIQDGMLKALQGITDVEEVFRVTQE